MSQSLIIHPEVAAQQTQLEELRHQSSKLYLEAEYMQFEERPLLLSLYETNIGKLQFEEFQLGVQIRLAQLETQLIQAYINRNERPNDAEIAARMKLEQEKFKMQIEEKEAEIKAAQDYLNAPTYSREETEELRNLYRIITKALHPDLHPGQTQKEHDMFLKAVTAYRAGDIHILRQIALAIAEETIEEIPETDLPRLIEQAKASVEAFQRRIEKMNAQFPFIYRKQLQDEQWLKEQKVEISERIAQAKAQLEQKKNYLMMLKLWKPDSLS